ncbi:unnamed protein product [Arabidopsis halleri]
MGDTSSGGARVTDTREQDESMEEDGRSPGLSSDGSRLWVEKVQGCNGGGIPIPEMVVEEGFVMSRMSLEFPSGGDGEAVGTIMVNGERYYVSYEGLSNICPVCGVFGHAGSVCPKRVSELVVQQTVAGNVTGSESEVGLEAVAKVSDGFTEVRNTGRRSGKTWAQGVKVFSAGGSGERQTQHGLDRIRDCSQVPMVLSNSFSGLEGETEGHVLSKEICSREENKENEQNTNVVNQVNDLNRSVGKQIVGRPVTEKIGTRGLIFGPTSGEVSGLATGKRLRVEHDNVGRAGGAYTSACTGISVLKPAQTSGKLGELVGELSTADGTSMDLVLHESSMDSGVAIADK